MKTKNIAIFVIALLIVAGTAIIAMNYYPETIGGDKDEYGCLIAAGYSYDEEVNACTRNWELNEEDREAVKIATAHLSYPVTVVEVEALSEGEYRVILQRNDNQERITTEVTNGEIVNKDRNFCTPSSREAEACTMEYNPVCGWYLETDCKEYPCAQTYSNPCIACQDSKVAYWTQGECPK